MKILFAKIQMFSRVKFCFHVLITGLFFLIISPTILFALPDNNLVAGSSHSYQDKDKTSNYRCFYPERIASYTSFNHPWEIVFVEVDDSQETEGGVAHIFGPDIELTDYQCFTPHGRSVLGEKMLRLDDGSDLFFNRDMDTIRIQTQATIGQSWQLYAQDSLIIMAEIIGFEPEEILGVTDSVKTILLSSFDRSMEPVESKVNNETIKLSKSFGLVKTYNWVHFPDFEIDYDSNEPLALVGLTNPNVGVTNFLWKEVLDFQPGDEMHVLESKQDVDFDSNTPSGYQSETKQIYHFLNRVDYQDSVTYTIKRYYSNKTIRTSASGSNTTHWSNTDTVSITYGFNAEFDLPARKPVFAEFQFDFRAHKQTMSEKILYLHEYWKYDDCFYFPISDGCFIYHAYIKGLGGPYYFCDYFFSRTSRDLQYYRRGNIEQGIPFDFTPVENQTQNTPIEIYPNPAKSWFALTLSQEHLPASIFLYDISGKNVFERNVMDPIESIDVLQLKNGFYFYRVNTINNQLFSGKIILQ